MGDFRRNSFVLSVLLLMFSLSLFYGCKKDSDDPVTPEQSDLDIKALFPKSVPNGVKFPVVILDTIYRPKINQCFSCTVDGIPQLLTTNSIDVKRGKGAGLLLCNQPGEYEIIISPDNTLNSNLALTINCVELVDPISVSGTIPIDQSTWVEGSIIHVTDDLTIPSGQFLHIEKGVIVLLNTNVNIFIEGEMSISGTEDLPVLFSTIHATEYWGEIFIDGGSAEYSHCFFTSGGNDVTREFGHSGSQPVIHVDDGSLNLSNCYFVDNPGKAVGAINSIVDVDSCLITRCDTGGEYLYTQLNVNFTWFLDMPNGNTNELDDDNDAIYVNDPPYNSAIESTITNCVFVTGKDDAIDHNGANLSVSNCIIDDFDNEGIAASDKNQITIFNTLIVNCEQGIEAGYGTPHVIVDHCLLMDNETGLRFGDWYTWRESEGILDVTNTISVNNSLNNVLNLIMSAQAPRDSSLFISYSIVNDPLYNSNEGNLSGTPIFDEYFYLTPQSPGYEAGSDNNSVGLIPQ